MWSLYESNRLTPDTELTGHFKQDHGPVDTSAVLGLIGDANREEAARRRARGQSTTGVEAAPAAVGRRREVVVEKTPPRGPRSGRPTRDGDLPRGGASQRSHSQRRSDSAHDPRGDKPDGRGPHPSRARTSDRRVSSKPKRGDNVQASTYVSPEARKTKVLALTPRGEAAAPKPPQPDKPKRRRARAKASSGESSPRGPNHSVRSKAQAPPTRNDEQPSEGKPAKSRRRRRRRSGSTQGSGSPSGSGSGSTV
jgi:hypothetical protein